jgi:hypothetical protein
MDIMACSCKPRNCVFCNVIHAFPFHPTLPPPLPPSLPPSSPALLFNPPPTALLPRRVAWPDQPYASRSAPSRRRTIAPRPISPRPVDHAYSCVRTTHAKQLTARACSALDTHLRRWARRSIRGRSHPSSHLYLLSQRCLQRRRVSRRPVLHLCHPSIILEAAGFTAA